MGQRLDLQALLETLLGSRNVYFQPPPELQISYPAIVYKRDKLDTKNADNRPYALKMRYMITIIDRNPDSLIPEKVALLPTALFNRHFKANNLNHDIYTLYF